MITTKDVIRVNIPEHVSVLCRPCYKENYWDIISRVCIAHDWYRSTEFSFKECLKRKGMQIVDRETPESECGGEHSFVLNITNNKVTFEKEY